MTTTEVTEQLARVHKFRALEKTRDEIQIALQTMEEPKVMGSGPFTGNTRESRQISSLRIEFTQTRGTAAPVGMDLKNLGIEAYEFGRELERMLHAKLEAVNSAMEKI